MKGGQPKVKENEPDPANLSEGELVSNQEATVVPWFCGERKFAVTWISPGYNQFTKDAGGTEKK